MSGGSTVDTGGTEMRVTSDFQAFSNGHQSGLSRREHTPQRDTPLGWDTPAWALESPGCDLYPPVFFVPTPSSASNPLAQAFSMTSTNLNLLTYLLINLHVYSFNIEKCKIKSH